MNNDNSSDEQLTDGELFRQTVGAVKPIKNASPIIEKPKPVARALMHEKDERQVIDDMLSDNHAHLDDSAELSYRQHGVQKKVLRNLHKGVYRIDASLDLHGYNREQARTVLLQFLADCRANDVRAIRIIHGRALNNLGQGVLKPLVNTWLRQRAEVLVFCSAPYHDGGQGAVYALLKNQRDKHKR